MPVVTNKNFFSPIQAEFNIKRLPNVGFFCQKVSIPGLTTMAVSQKTPFTTIRHPGDHLEYNELQVTFKIDEYLTNYREVYDWLVRLGFPESHAQYRQLSKTGWDGEGPTSDASVIFLDSKSNPKLEVEIVDLFPVELSDIVVDTTLSDVDYVTATALFAYTLYRIKPLVGTDP